MTNRPLLIALLLSLALNIAVIAGYAYQRYFSAPETQLDVVATRLELNASERTALLELRKAVFANVRELRRRSAEPNARLRRLVADSRADDPELAQALDRIADERAQIQADAIHRLVAFRDSLSPPARQRFGEAIVQKGFLLSLFGVNSWGLPTPGND